MSNAAHTPNPMAAYLPFAGDAGTTTLGDGFFAWLMATREA